MSQTDLQYLYCNVTPVLESLHWLPIKYRIHFKIVLLTFKCIYGLAPQYLVKLISIKTNSKYRLRSCDGLSLIPPTSGKCLATLGDRAFQSATPKLWNGSLASIRCIDSFSSFKTALKTYLFRLVFRC